MITVNNYQQQRPTIDFKAMPEAIRATDAKFEQLAPYYGKNPAITETLDIYIAKLNEAVAAKSTTSATAKTVQTEAKSVQKAAKTVQTKPKKVQTKAKSVQKEPKTVQNKAKSVQKAAKTVQTKAKPGTTAKTKVASAKKKPTTNNRQPSTIPATVKKSSLELGLIKRAIALNGKEYKKAYVTLLAKTFKNALPKISDHKGVIEDLSSKLNQAAANMEAQNLATMKFEFEKGNLEKLKGIVANAKVRLRVEFLAGQKK